ncbi:sigma-70 family RNA polymerase sigma factor [filamentous cyanobacterium LEGE 11480]|uniref:Sigma-70 family RNA polymerase sigma factor n=1 Tax=Romeriopsis navalis LEGE 11480 TaxID=2777977 RepID=A0A928Z6U1_9CYAN|nr:sigma-70 family RNA polymerase sigma factor [Romeriopsis navalis]MBE9032555.1 sigma-70 family RNA polymerase sigma factor [Romeriopsis navalis LEGE 11480]
MAELNQTLKDLVAEACRYPVGNPKRQRLYTQIYRLVTKSRKLWRDSNPYYGDALQEMWEYCFRNLEEYDPNISQVTTWMDNRLKKRLRYHRDVTQRNRQRKQQPIATSEGMFDPVDRLAAHSDTQPSLDIWAQTAAWVKSDPEEVLRNTCFRKRPEINAQVVILKRLPPDTPWKDIASELQLSVAESKDLPKWYNRHCMTLLKKFARQQGYIE